MPRKDTNAGASTAKAQQEAASDGIDAYELPKSLVTKLARSALPDGAKMQKETVIALTKGSTVFVNYLAATAHDVATQKQHKSVSATDVLKALELLDLGDMLPKLQDELQAHRDLQKSDKGKRPGPKPKPKDASESASAKGKGKAKESASATITIPSRGSRQGTASEPMDGDEQAVSSKVGNLDEDEEMANADDQDGAEDEIDEDEDVGDDDEGEEMVDQLELEEAELRKDARGVEERDHYREED